MRALSLVLLIALFGCQKTEESVQKTEPLPLRVAQSEEELELDKQNFVFVPNIPGVKIEGENISSSGTLMVAENLRIYDIQGKLLDDFTLFDWGPIGFKTEGKFLKIYPIKEVLEVMYETSDKGPVARSSSCHFTTRPAVTKFDDLIAQARGPKPDWELIFSELGELAMSGDKRSADFFLAPDAVQLKMHKQSPEAGALGQTIKVLKFMKKEGCRW